MKEAVHGSSLEHYFRELEAQDLMNPRQEAEAATRILELRREYWARLFAYPPFVIPILDAIALLVPVDKRGLLSLARGRKLAERRQRRPNQEHRTQAENALRELAEQLADVDPTCDVADVINADIEAIATGQSHRARLNVRTPRSDSLPFERFVQGVRRGRLVLDAARRDFARANLRLVVTLAHRYKRSGRLPLADLIQEGNVGLMTAVDRFDPRRGYRFSTYGSWWIRHAISRALSDKGRVVRLPVHVIELQGKISRLRRAFEHIHCRAPTHEELATQLGVPVEKIERLDRTLLEQDAPPSAQDDASRDPDIDGLPDEVPGPDTVLHEGRLDGALEEALEILRPMEADVLRMRFGLDGEPSRTLREIGEIYSLSRERIRQIQERALGKLRAHLETRGFTSSPSSAWEVRS